MIKQSRLAVYHWRGKNKQNQPVKGVQLAMNAIALKVNLKQQGVSVSRIWKKLNWSWLNAIRPRDIMMFTNYLIILLKSGVSLIKALKLIGSEQTNLHLYHIIDLIRKTIESGHSFADSLRKFPKYFNTLYCNLIAIGEASGTLNNMLESLLSYQERIYNLKSKIKKAIIYPCITILFAFVVTMVLLIYVVPQFQMLFENFNAVLPGPTRFVIMLSDLLQKRLGFTFFVSSFSMGILWLIFRQRYRFQQKLDHIKLYLPLFGDFIGKVILSRYVQTLAITVSSGMPLINALKSAGEICNNAVYYKANEQICRDIESGQSLHQAFHQTHLFPNHVVQMITIGEESGDLETMLAKIANIFETEIEDKLAYLTSLIEPSIMAILGLMIGGLVIAMYLPIFKLGAIIS